LTGRRPGQSYSREQRQRILDTVQKFKSQGVSTTCALQGLRVPRSTFYFWRSDTDRKTRPTAYNALLEHETQIAGPVSLYNRKRFISGKLPVHAATGVWERVPK
jgi:hypothetical protein